MAVTNQTIQDSRWRTIIKTTITGTNSVLNILDASSLVGWVTGSIVNLAAVEWSIADTSVSTHLIWDATSNVVILDFTGNGSYGGSDGMPAIANNAAVANRTGDVLLTTSGGVFGTLVCVYHKVETTAGHGNGWTA